MIFNIRKKFFILLLAVAFIGIGIYFYELPTTEDRHLHNNQNEAEYPKESIHHGKYLPKKNGYNYDNTRSKNSKSNQKKEKYLGNFDHETENSKIRYPKVDEAPERKYLSNTDIDDQTEYVDLAQSINSTLWEWLNLVKGNGKDEGKARSTYYCRPSEQIISGAEGQIVDGFTLEHVHVLIRHGDRSPIYSLPHYGTAVLDCDLHKKETPHKGPPYDPVPNEPILRDYTTYMKTLWEVLGPESHGAKFGLYPRIKKCEGAQLTPKGVLQHLKNGEYLRQIYVNKLRLFGRDDIHSKMVIRTTDYTRTYQSALAFAYGFIRDFDYFKLKIKFSRLTNFCSRQLTQMKCECKALYRLQTAIEEEYANRSRSSRLHNEIKQELGEIFDVETSKLPWIAAALDVVMGHFCHRILLPCSEDGRRCLTHDLINRMWRFVDFHGSATQSSYANVKYSRLTMHPLLSEIYNRMLNVTLGSERTKFYLYSGHDTTVAQLRTALGINDGLWPPYASRLIFELYSGKQELKKYYFIRVLYNGQDFTRRVSFCKNKPTPHGLCPLEYLKNFSQHENLRAYGKTDYATVCQI